jgi:hypothetical protein
MTAMTAQEQSLGELAALLDELRVPYMVIGGMANAVWGEPRATLDIDVTVWVPEPQIGEVIDALAARLEVLVDEPRRFVADTRVLPLRGPRGVRVDLVFGLLSFEAEAIRRARAVEVGGTSVRFCTAEDLVLHKIISSRPRDLDDARGVVVRQAGVLDLGYLEPRVAELAASLDQPEIAARWQAWKRAAGLAS